MQLVLVFRYASFGFCVIVVSEIHGWNGTNAGIIWTFVETLIFLNSSMNPFFYYWKRRDVRHEVKATSALSWWRSLLPDTFNLLQLCLRDTNHYSYLSYLPCCLGRVILPNSACFVIGYTVQLDHVNCLDLCLTGNLTSEIAEDDWEQGLWLL